MVNLNLLSLKRKKYVLVAIGVLFPFCMFAFLSVPDVASEEKLTNLIAELQIKLQYLNQVYQSQLEDVRQLTMQLEQSKSFIENISSDVIQNSEINPEIQRLLRNYSGLNIATGLYSSTKLRLPSAFHFLPHLLDDPTSLRLAFQMTKHRSGVSMVLGIPTVHREKQNYLLDTLTSLIDGMSQEEANDSLIVIFVAETNLSYVLQVAKEVETRFLQQIDSGIIEIISPSPAYYPNLDDLPQTLGDSAERVRWRSKQNLDYAFLMSYCQPKGTFYVQLEDDILAKPNYIQEMKNFALSKISKKEPWFVLDFCRLGFIGKMFKNTELPWIIQFFYMFYSDKPVDWLLYSLIYTKLCSIDKNQEFCKKEKSKLWIHYRPSLFQHIGVHSSLKGKLQKLKDRQFGKVALFFPHSNPDSEVVTSIKHYKLFTLENAYLGENFFWGIEPRLGDYVLFKFSKPTVIKKYLFRSGNAEHPADKFYNTTIEVLLANPEVLDEPLNFTEDGYFIIGNFDETGIATSKDLTSLGKLLALRLYLHSDSENWVILSEISIESVPNS